MNTIDYNMHTMQYLVHKQWSSQPVDIDSYTTKELFILYVKLNFHETKLNFSQSTRVASPNRILVYLHAHVYCHIVLNEIIFRE